MVDNDGEAIKQRLHVLGRTEKPHPFGVRMKMDKGVIHRMLRGTWPVAGTLRPLYLAERVNLGWLLTGEGAPYVVVGALSDAGAWRTVREMFADEPGVFEVELVEAPGAWTAVLHAPRVGVDGAGNPFEYRQVAVIAASGGPILAAGLGQWSQIVRIHAMKLDPGDFGRLIQGRMGNAELWERREASEAAGRARVLDVEEWCRQRSPEAVNSDPRSIGVQCLAALEGETLDLVQRMLVAAAGAPVR